MPPTFTVLRPLCLGKYGYCPGELAIRFPNKRGTVHLPSASDQYLSNLQIPRSRDASASITYLCGARLSCPRRLLTLPRALRARPSTTHDHTRFEGRPAWLITQLTGPDRRTQGAAMLRQSIPTLQAGRTATAIYSDKGELLVE